MDKIYTSYKCMKCKREFILLTDDLKHSQRRGEYICCPYCSSKKILKDKERDSVKECMEHSVYRREKGALRQIR